MKQKIRLSESELKRMISESVKRVLNEQEKKAYDPYEEGDAYEELIDNLSDAYDGYISAINALQEFVYNHDASASDMYNSAAGKYGDEAKELARRSYNRLSQIFYSEEDF